MKTFFFLLTVTLASVSLILVLFLYSRREEDRDNGFMRKFPPHIASAVKEYDLGVNSYYISGFSADSVYLGNTTVPNRFVAINKLLSDTVQHYVHIDRKDTLWGGIRLTVDSPHVFITQTTRPKVRLCSLDGQIIDEKSIHAKAIVHLFPLRGSSILGKDYDGDTHQSFLFKQSLDGTCAEKRLKVGSNQADIFATDGIIAFDHTRSRFAYVYYYQNTVKLIDTNLQVLNTFNTVDTFSVPRLSIGFSKQQTNLSFAATPRTVNKESFIYDSLLYVHSAVKSNNEELRSFKENIAIDAYNINTGRYLFSFYLPMHKGHTCSSINIDGDTIFAIYDRYIISFQLHLRNYRGAR